MGKVLASSKTTGISLGESSSVGGKALKAFY